MTKVITFGTFDVFHVGHLSLLERAGKLGDTLVVGVSSDTLSLSKKGRTPIFPLEERKRIIGAVKCVNEVFTEESLEEKANYVKAYKAEILVMGDDWRGKFDHLRDICDVVYLERTPSISTTALIELIRD